MSPKERILGLINKEPNFAQIAVEVGVSREYVRQVAAAIGMTSPYRSIRHEIVQEFRFPRVFPRLVKRWLWSAGYSRCGCCRLWINRGDMPSKNVCRTCNAIRVNDYLHRTGRVRDYYTDSRRKYPIQGKGRA